MQPGNKMNDTMLRPQGDNSNNDDSQEEQNSFPVKLHKLLEIAPAEGYDDVISWQPHGKAFRIHNRERFVQEILPRYFPQQSRFASLQRQLNLYDFKRLSRKNADSGAYFHELFVRDIPQLCLKMQRIKNKGKVGKAWAPKADPDFYISTGTPRPTKTDRSASSRQQRRTVSIASGHRAIAPRVEPGPSTLKQAPAPVVSSTSSSGEDGSSGHRPAPAYPAAWGMVNTISTGQQDMVTNMFASEQLMPWYGAPGNFPAPSQDVVRPPIGQFDMQAIQQQWKVWANQDELATLPSKQNQDAKESRPEEQFPAWNFLAPPGSNNAADRNVYDSSFDPLVTGLDTEEQSMTDANASSSNVWNNRVNREQGARIHHVGGNAPLQEAIKPPTVLTDMLTFESQPLLVFGYDAENRVVHVNAAFERFMSLSRRELVDRPLTTVFPALPDLRKFSDVVTSLRDGRGRALTVQLRTGPIYLAEEERDQEPPYWTGLVVMMSSQSAAEQNNNIV